MNSVWNSPPLFFSNFFLLMLYLYSNIFSGISYDFCKKLPRVIFSNIFSGITSCYGAKLVKRFKYLPLWWRAKILSRGGNERVFMNRVIYHRIDFLPILASWAYLRQSRDKFSMSLNLERAIKYFLSLLISSWAMSMPWSSF